MLVSHEMAFSRFITCRLGVVFISQYLARYGIQVDPSVNKSQKETNKLERSRIVHVGAIIHDFQGFDLNCFYYWKH